ncbi:MAG: hypothetical protein IT306_24145 [Chloroflexi bacterium]|nr:hypothetical protein [Chloroflexota bacterium]
MVPPFFGASPEAAGFAASAGLDSAGLDSAGLAAGAACVGAAAAGLVSAGLVSAGLVSAGLLSAGLAGAAGCPQAALNARPPLSAANAVRNPRRLRCRRPKGLS